MSNTNEKTKIEECITKCDICEILFVSKDEYICEKCKKNTCEKCMEKHMLEEINCIMEEK